MATLNFITGGIVKVGTKRVIKLAGAYEVTAVPDVGISIRVETYIRTYKFDDYEVQINGEEAGNDAEEIVARLYDEEIFFLDESTGGEPGEGGAAGVSDTAYDATTWNNVTDTAPSKNAVRDKIASMEAAQAAADSAVQAYSIQRANHTGQQASSTISDLTETVQDIVAAFLSQGTNVTLSYNDAGNTLTVTASTSGGLDAEGARDALGVALVGVGNITVTVNDAADTITISTTATVNSTDAALRDRSTHTGTQSADTITDGTANKVYTATEKTKLSGIATGATANSSDATLLARANHTGTQPSTSISDFTEAVQDAVAAFLAAGTNVTVSYDDAGNVLTVSASGTGGGGIDAETARDVIGVAMAGVGNISVTINDAADTITISTTATVNSTDAALRDRSTHTGTQSADTLTDGTTNKAYLATERTKLSGIATGATANSSDATLLARANHTGTQSADTITDGTTNKAYLATEKTKLAGIATGATANSADATLLDRANHTGTQAATTITEDSTHRFSTDTEKSTWNGKANKDAHSTLTYASTTNLDFDTDNFRTVTLTGNVTFTTSNKGTMKEKVVRVICDTSSRTFLFPSGWVWLGAAAPASIAASKTAILSLKCFGSAESDIVAAYSVEA